MIRPIAAEIAALDIGGVGVDSPPFPHGLGHDRAPIPSQPSIKPSGSVVRVLIAPPISRRTAETSRGGPKYPRIGAFPPGRLGLRAFDQLIAEDVVAIGVGVDEFADVARRRHCVTHGLEHLGGKRQIEQRVDQQGLLAVRTRPALLQPQEPSGCK
jgi:hypothetical protein